MGAVRVLQALSVSLALAGCGATVPALTELPAGVGESELLARSIAETVRCEIRGAAAGIVEDDITLARTRNGTRTVPWFDGWGAQVQLVLTAEEKTAIAPVGSFSPLGGAAPPFTLGLAALGSAAATRSTTLNYFYTVAELRRSPPCVGRPEGPTGSLLQMQSDLRIRESLAAHILSAGTGAIAVSANRAAPGGQQVVGHRIKFEVLTSGSVSPVWRLSRATLGQGGTLFSTSRQRVHDLTVFFGPTDPFIPRALTPPAQAAFLAAISRPGL